MILSGVESHDASSGAGETLSQGDYVIGEKRGLDSKMSIGRDAACSLANILHK